MRCVPQNIVLILLLAAASVMNADPGVVLRILDKKTFQPVSFASVVVRNFGGLSQVMEADRAGICQTTLVNGKFQVLVKAKGYHSIDTTVRIHKDMGELSLFLSKVYTQDSLVEIRVSSQSTTVQLDIREEIAAPEIIEPAPVILPVPANTHIETDSVPELENEVKPEAALEDTEQAVMNIDYKPANLVFLIDCSSSMRLDGKMELAKRSVINLIEELNEKDRISLVAYGSEARVVMETQLGNNRNEITNALAKLVAKGTTKTGSGLDEAYRMASGAFIEKGMNEVVLITDGAIYDIGGSIIKRVNEGKGLGVSLSVVGVKNQAWTESGLRDLVELGGGVYLHLGSEGGAEEQLKQEIRKRAALNKDGK